MKSILKYLWLFPVFICVGCKNKTSNDLILIEDQGGYVLQDKKNRIDIVRDAKSDNITISTGDKIICVIEANFSEHDKKFWDSSKMYNDPIHSGGLIIDKYMDGLPDQLTLGSQLGEKYDRFSGLLNLGTYIVDNDGNPVIRVKSVEGKFILEE